MTITVMAAWPPGRPEDSKEGDQKRKESRSFVPTKYVTYKVQLLGKGSDHEGQEMEEVGITA